MSKSNGFTTGDGEVGTVHPETYDLSCTCGGAARVTVDGDLVDHTEPADMDAEHMVVPFWSKSIWSYMLVS